MSTHHVQQRTLNNHARSVYVRITMVLFFLIACLAGGTVPAHAQITAPRVVTLQDVSSNPGAYEGQRVTLRGKLQQVVGANGFQMGDKAAPGGNSLLVVEATKGIIPFTDARFVNTVQAGVNVQVTGVVRTFDLQAIEREVGFDLDNALYNNFAGNATVVASNVEIVGNLSDIADATQAYAGLPVTVYGDITRMLTPYAFQLDDPAVPGFDTVLVIARNRQVFPENVPLFNPEVFRNDAPDVSVLVHGIVRPVDTDIRALEAELGYDLEDNLLADHAEDGILIAEWLNLDVSLSSIAEDPASFEGMTVTIRGDVVKRVGLHAFELDDEATLGGDTVLVVAASPETFTPPDNAVVTGKVRLFGMRTIQDEIGYDLNNILFQEYTGDAVVVATTIAPDASR